MKRGIRIIGTTLLLGSLTALGGCVYPPAYYQRTGVTYSDDGQYYGGNAAVDAYDYGAYYEPGYYYDPWWGYGPYIGLGFYGGGYWGGHGYRGPWRHGYGGGGSGGHWGHSATHGASHTASAGRGGGGRH